MKMKSALIAALSFFFIATQAIVSSADDQSTPPRASRDYQWVLWKVVQNQQGPVSFAKDAFRTKESCKTHIPHETSIYGEGPEKKGYVCLPRGLKPFYSLSLRNENHIPLHPEQSSASGN